jgi:hypothetical protein
MYYLIKSKRCTKSKRWVDTQETIRLVVVPLLQQVKQKEINYNDFDSIKKLLYMVNESR